MLDLDEPVTHRDTEALATLQDERWEEHRRAHEAEDTATSLALENVEAREEMHRAAHSAAHTAHDEKHVAERQAVSTALEAVNRERTIHAGAHQREHEGHQREHMSGQLAIDKAEQANDRRFAGVNATREQMADILRSLASKDTVDGMTADMTRRWEENRKELDRRFGDMLIQITNLEKGDMKVEGKEMGRNSMVAIIVTAITVGVTILGALIAVFNVATG